MNDPASMVAQAMSIYGTVSKQQSFGGSGGSRCVCDMCIPFMKAVGRGRCALVTGPVRFAYCARVVWCAPEVNDSRLAWRSSKVQYVD